MTTAGGHFNGKAEAPAEMIPEFMAIFNMTTSTELASPPAATVAYVNMTIINRVAKMTNIMNNTELLYSFSQATQRNDAACL